MRLRPPLLARYDLAAAAAAVTPEQLAARPPDLWRYQGLLPVGSRPAVVSLGEGLTPLLALPRLGAALGLPGLMVKDEGRSRPARSRPAARRSA